MIESEDELISRIQEALEVSRETNPELEEKLRKNLQILENMKNSYLIPEKNLKNEKNLEKKLKSKIYPEKNMSTLQKSNMSYLSSQKQSNLIMNFEDSELSCPVILHESYLNKTEKAEKAIICIDSKNLNVLLKNVHKCLDSYKNLNEEQFEKIEEQNTRSLKYSGEAKLIIPIDKDRQNKVTVRLYNSDSIARLHNLNKFFYSHTTYKSFLISKNQSENSNNNIKTDKEIRCTRRYDDFVNSYFVQNQKKEICLNLKEELHFDSMTCKETNLNFKKLLNDNSTTVPDKNSKETSKIKKELTSNNNLEFKNINDMQEIKNNQNNENILKNLIRQKIENADENIKNQQISLFEKTIASMQSDINFLKNNLKNQDEKLQKYEEIQKSYEGFLGYDFQKLDKICENFKLEILQKEKKVYELCELIEKQKNEITELTNVNLKLKDDYNELNNKFQINKINQQKLSDDTENKMDKINNNSKPSSDPKNSINFDFKIEKISTNKITGLHNFRNNAQTSKNKDAKKNQLDENKNIFAKNISSNNAYSPENNIFKNNTENLKQNYSKSEKNSARKKLNFDLINFANDAKHNNNFYNFQNNLENSKITETDKKQLSDDIKKNIAKITNSNNFENNEINDESLIKNKKYR